jgi:hypothetical protein
MTKQDRQKLNILVVLVAVLGLTLVLGYRMNQPATTAAVQPPEPQKTSVNPPAANDARIRLDLVDKSESGDGGVGKKNVFQYQQAPPPPPPILKPVTPPPAVGPRGGGNASAGSNPISTVPPGPPPPPPIPLKYQGYAALDRPGGGFTAFVADDSRHYNVSVGEVLMGRYRILGISDKSVEVEDLEFKRRQTLALQK